MFKLLVKRQQEYITARTQDYRMVLEVQETGATASSSSSSNDFENIYPPNVNLFRVYREDTGVEHFDGVVQPREFIDLEDTPEIGTYRTNVVDLYWPSDLLADAGLAAIVADITNLLQMSYGGTVEASIDGVTI